MKKIPFKSVACYLREPVFNSSCNFYINTPLAKVKKICERTRAPNDRIDWSNLEDAFGFHLHFMDRQNHTVRVLWLQNFAWTAKGVAMLNHELIHLVGHILDHRGVPSGVKNDEVFAYLFEHYSDMILSRLAKKFT